MRFGAARARHRAGKAYPPRWAAYVKLQDGKSEFGSRHCCTMSPSTCCTGRSINWSGTRQPVSTASHGTSTKRVLRAISSTSAHGYTVVRTERSRPGDNTSPNPMVGNGHSASRRWKTRSSSERVVEILNAIYETDFLGFSYGFRPKRSQHNALDALATAIYRKKVNWILDADIQAFFDTVNWEWLVRFLEHRIADRRLLRLIGKWLKAGVLEDGRLLTVERGTPQGAVISPVLANIYLHYVYDLWVQHWRRQNDIGEVIVVRYADDTVVGFQHRSDAERFLDELRERLKKFGLELHPQKTRIIEFGRFAARNRKARGLGKPETFAFLGFTHICGTSKSGGYLILRHTIGKRLREKIRQVKETIRRMMHRPITEQALHLRRVMNGYFNYFAVPTNNRAINSFYYHVIWHWHRTLARRSQNGRMPWERMKRLIDRWLPPARLRHPLPDVRFRVMTQGGSPVR